MEMLPVQSINGNQFVKARTLMLPVVVLDMRTFRIASASCAERDHVVTFDSSESPTQFSCACQAFEKGVACWAAARALDVMALLQLNDVYVLAGRDPSPARGLPAAPPLDEQPPPLVASIGEAGDMALMLASAPAPLPHYYAPRAATVSAAA